MVRLVLFIYNKVNIIAFGVRNAISKSTIVQTYLFWETEGQYAKTAATIAKYAA